MRRNTGRVHQEIVATVYPSETAPDGSARRQRDVWLARVGARINGAGAGSAVGRIGWTQYTALTTRALIAGLEDVRPFAWGQVLDVGCGAKPYEAMLRGRATAWVGVDFPQAFSGWTRANVFASALAMPFKDCAFDTVVSTEVLEHLPEPARDLQEMFRVLRPGGHVISTTPFYYGLHEEPRDYFRYTAHGLRYLATQAGFTVVLLEPCGDVLSVIGQLVAYWLPLGRAGSWKSRAMAMARFAVQRLCAQLDRRHHWGHDPLRYVMVCAKPVTDVLGA
ncbi:MAG: class I SAM-dependent methyltransferase [Chloroflexi bacterium]|nr:class I SAM-dependent methyltransferase [Chloroflexota bacterium]